MLIHSLAATSLRPRPIRVPLDLRFLQIQRHPVVRQVILVVLLLLILLEQHLVLLVEY